MILTQDQLTLENSLRRILPAGVVSCWIPDGYNRVKDVIGGNHGDVIGANPNVPIIQELGPNLLLNGDMELGSPPSDWTLYAGAWESEAGIVHRGSASGKFTRSGTSQLVYQRKDVVIGKKYRITGYVFLPTASGATTVRLYVGSGNVGPPMLDHLQGESKTKDSWAKITGEFEAKASSLYINFALGENGYAYFDSLSFRELKSSLTNPHVGWHLDALDDQLDLNNPASLDITEKITLATWTYVNARTNSYPMLIEKLPVNSAWQLMIDQSAGFWNRAISFRWEGAEHWDIEATGLSEKTWFFVAGTHDGTTGKIFINAELKNSLEANFIASTGGKVVIGGEGYRYQWDGYSVIPLIAKRDLSQQELNNIYLNTKGMFAPRG